MLGAMTTRMTVALSILGIGLAISALAGVPFLLAAPVAGTIVMFGGFAVGIAGFVTMLTAIDGQKVANARERMGRTIDIEQLQLERRSLKLRQNLNKTKRERLRKQGWLEGENMREGIDLIVEGADLDTLLRRNTNEFRRLGEEPSETPPTNTATA